MRSPLVALLAIALVVATGCQLFEPKPAELLSSGAANLKAAKTVHMNGRGTYALKDGMSLQFDFTFDGDASFADTTSHITIEMSMLGQNLSTESITLPGKAYAKNPVTGTWTESANAAGTPGLDPLGNTDLSGVENVVEIDRPSVDGKGTRHLGYTVSNDKLREAMTRSAGGTSGSVSVSDIDGRGEIWIRTDDRQIVRQLVKVSFGMSGAGLGLPTTGAGSGSATFSISMDMKFSKHGEPIPQITAPPIRR